MHDTVQESLVLINVALEKLLGMSEVPELATSGLADAIDHLGAANDILRDEFNAW